MKKGNIQQIVVFGLLLFSLGCSPVPAAPGGPNNAEKASDTDPTVMLATPIFATPQIVHETLDIPIDKTPQPFSFEYPMYSGETLTLKGGLTNETRSLLQSGSTGYFLICFANPSDPSIPQALKDSRIRNLFGNIGWIFAEVPPSALQSLETWSRSGFLAYGGPLPPAGKIEPALAEAVDTSPNGTVEVTVILFKKPDEAAKQQIDRLFTEVHWGQSMPEIRPAFDGRIESKNVGALSKSSIVLGILKPAVPTLP